MQRAFSLKALAAGLLMVPLLLFAHLAFIRLPNRVELGPRQISIRLDAVAVEVPAGVPYRIAAAYRLSAGDRRFGAVSGLAADRGHLVAVTDSGVVIHFAKPTGRERRLRATVRELPGGPGSARFKSGRDSESIARDPAGRGWWVGFERHDEVWLYDPQFGAALRRLAIHGQDWHYNRGIEGLAAEPGGLWLFPEQGESALFIGAAGVRRFRLDGVGGDFPWDGWVAEAAMLPDGRILFAERSLGPTGFVNRLAVADVTGARVAVRASYPLPLGPLDNVEAIAADPAPGGGVRLWLMTDNDHRPSPRTLLLAIDLPAVRPVRPRPPR